MTSVVAGSVRKDEKIDFSIIIPSVRDQKALKKNCELIPRCHPYSYEIIVVSPNDPEFTSDRLTWVKEEKVRGCVSAQNTGAAHSSGDYLITMPDDWLIGDGWWNAKHLLENSKLPFPVAGICQYKLFSEKLKCDVWYPAMPCIPKSVSAKLLGGGIYNPAYIYHYPDVDLGVRLHCLRSPTIRVPCALPDFSFNRDGHDADEWGRTNRNKYDYIDQNTFKHMWGKFLGGEWSNPDESFLNSETLLERLKVSLWLPWEPIKFL